MEKKTYNWLLYQFAQRNICLNILEVGICKRDKLLDWYSLDQKNSIRRNSVTTPNNLTKYLLNHFLAKRSPILDEYRPDKFVCYLYHKSGKKIITAKEAAEMANNQLHGLQVLSIHMALPGIDTPKIFRVSCINKNNELSTDISVENFYKEGGGNSLKDQEIADKIMNFTLNICEILGRFSKPIESMKLDVIISSAGLVYLIKAIELVFSVNGASDGIRDLRRKSTFKYKDEESSPEITDEEEQSNGLLFNREGETKTKDSSRYKIPLSKPVQNNSVVFLDMIAKTIEKKRKNEIIHEYFTKKPSNIEGYGNYKRSVFRLNSFQSIKDKDTESKIATMNDLLAFIEKTRPRNWIKDLSKSSAILVKNSPAKLVTFSGRRGSTNYVSKVNQDIPNLDSKAHYFKKSKLIYTIKEISPIRLSHKRATSTILCLNASNLKTPLL